VPLLSLDEAKGACVRVCNSKAGLSTKNDKNGNGHVFLTLTLNCISGSLYPPNAMGHPYEGRADHGVTSPPIGHCVGGVAGGVVWWWWWWWYQRSVSI